MLEVYIDGASAGNPGLSGAGIFIKGNDVLEEYSLPLGLRNNHEAEFYALIHALEICQKKNYKVVSFRTDSKIVSDSIEKQFVKRSEFKPLLAQALSLIQTFDLFFIKWIPEKNNQQADRLARAAIHKNEFQTP